MEQINHGGPAFPHLHNTCQRMNESEMFPGMSLRDYFAGQALAIAQKEHVEQETHYNLDDIARGAYAYADAMLTAREVRNG